MEKKTERIAKRWELVETSSKEEIKKLSQELNNLDETLTNILIQRGVNTFDKSRDYFRPSLDKIHDPFLMKDMDKGVERLNEAIRNQQKILVYGDYDVDGTTSVALVYSYLLNFYSELEYYIPNRYTEGYGVSFDGIDYATENDFKLIISLDCGIKAVEKIDYANKKGVDFIICDHHRPGDKLPNAVAVLDPKREDCSYPYKELSGCGVGFKLMQAWSQKNEIDKEKLLGYLDLLAISTCADIVPITGENRIFVHYGLKVINKHPRKGIKAMIKLANLKKELTVMDVVFTIAPRINAAGRIESGNKAVELLVADNEELAEASGKKVNDFNIERKGLDKEITTEALAIIDNDVTLQQQKTTVLYKEDWHKGVVGIVASRLIETYYRPTIILTESNGKATGSARSVKGFDVYNAIDACSDLLEQFGGHKYAAGLTMLVENIPAFSKKFEEVVNEQIEEHMLIPEININAKLRLDQIDRKFHQVLKQFAPFGPSNMNPVFISEGVLEKGEIRIVGESHLKMEVFQEEDSLISFPCIGFNLGKKIEEIAPGVPFDIAYTIEENHWNGVTSLQLNIKDIRF